MLMVRGPTRRLRRRIMSSRNSRNNAIEDTLVASTFTPNITTILTSPTFPQLLMYSLWGLGFCWEKNDAPATALSSR
jgi:hypothetical protein